MAKKSIEEIIRQQKPGFRVSRRVESAADDEVASVDATSHSMHELKRKYLGPSPGLDEATEAATMRSRNDDLEIVAVEPETTDDTGNAPPHRSKAAVVSKKTGRIIGEQG